MAKDAAVQDRSTLTADQRACYDLFSDLVGGDHHMMGTVRAWGRGLRWNMTCPRLATYDFDGLTRLVLLAHDRCIRVEIIPSGPNMVGITAHRRHSRDGDMWGRHPTMEEAIKYLRPTEPQRAGDAQP